jgi:hypothetical protein
MAPFSSKRSKFDTPGPTRKLFTRESHNFRYHRKPTIVVTAPSLPPSGQPGNLNSLANTASPAELFPTLTWHFESPIGLEPDLVIEKQQKTKEFLVIVEDLDGNSILPLTTSPLLGIFYGIPASSSSISGNQLVKVKKGKLGAMLERVTVAQRDLIGGFKYGDVDGKVWRAPKKGHRVHFQVVALSKTADTTALSEHPTKECFRGAVEGFVLGWGEWVGIWEK